VFLAKAPAPIDVFAEMEAEEKAAEQKAAEDTKAAAETAGGRHRREG
jgi:hypothetical protein